MAAVLLFSCNGQADKSGTVKDQSVPANAEWQVVTLDVEGMTCEGCEKTINASVESLPGIGEVESSHVEKYTRVKFDKNSTSVEEITQKITDTGYEVKGERSAADS